LPDDAERGKKDYLTLSFLGSNPQDCTQASFHILFRCGPTRDTDSHHRLASPHCSTTPASAIFLNPTDNTVRCIIITE
jgi:hypothetical protein